MAIVSNGGDQQEAAEQLEIECYFEAIIGSKYVGFKKPMPEIFEMALRKLAITTDQAIMVGDDWEADIIGAHGAGIKAVHLNRTDEPSPGKEAINGLRGVLRFLS